MILIVLVENFLDRSSVLRGTFDVKVKSLDVLGIVCNEATKIFSAVTTPAIPMRPNLDQFPKSAYLGRVDRQKQSFQLRKGI